MSSRDWRYVAQSRWFADNCNLENGRCQIVVLVDYVEPGAYTFEVAPFVIFDDVEPGAYSFGVAPFVPFDSVELEAYSFDVGPVMLMLRAVPAARS